MVSLSAESKPSRRIPSRRAGFHLSPAVASLFVHVGQVLLHTHTPTIETKLKKKKGKMKRPSHSGRWSMTKLCKKKKSSPFKSNCPAWGVGGGGVKGGQGGQGWGSPTPGPLSVTGQLTGVNAHSSQLSRTCDGGKGKQRSSRGQRTHKYGAFERLNWVMEEA